MRRGVEAVATAAVVDAGAVPAEAACHNTAVADNIDAPIVEIATDLAPSNIPRLTVMCSPPL
jgi:hypothetical protein